MTPFYLIDVFTTEPFSGNPLAVVSDADELSTELMRRIAGELNQTETTFVLTPTHPRPIGGSGRSPPPASRCSASATTRWGPGGGSPPPGA